MQASACLRSANSDFPSWQRNGGCRKPVLCPQSLRTGQHANNRSPALSRDVIRWTFAIDTEEYAGSFERELAEYVTGIPNEYRSSPDLLARAMRELEGIDPDLPQFTGPFADLFEARIVDFGDNQTVDFASTVPTPGWSNVHGRPYRVSLKRPFRFPAYLSVGLFLAKKPTARQLALLVARARQFKTIPKVSTFDERPTVVRCRLLMEIITKRAQTVADFRQRRRHRRARTAPA